MQSELTKPAGFIPIKGKWPGIKQYIKGYQRATYAQGKARPSGWPPSRAFLLRELTSALRAALVWTLRNPLATDVSDFYW